LEYWNDGLIRIKTFLSGFYSQYSNIPLLHVVYSTTPFARQKLGPLEPFILKKLENFRDIKRMRYGVLLEKSRIVGKLKGRLACNSPPYARFKYGPKDYLVQCIIEAEVFSL
jgi:hypothetical protein